jgi:hypothetical protein
MFANADLEDPLVADLQALIRDAASGAARSLQRAPGPSEIGDPCLRRLAYKLVGPAPTNTTIDPLPSTDGTAFHEWVAPAVTRYNTQHGRIRFISEQRVEIRTGLRGTLDVYDADTRTVIDWKRPGATNFKKYKADGPGEQYRQQVHLYGMGLTRLELPVERVAIAFLPRGGLLSGLHLWQEPYDPGTAQAALDRYDQLLCVIHDLDLESHPENWPLIPKTPAHCAWCPWWSANSTDVSTGCPGENGTPVPTSSTHLTTQGETHVR